jgi:parvulin-like peptidyl-prolyl isomerase
MRFPTLLSLFLAAGLLAASACGDDDSDSGLPDDALARVGSTSITEADLDRGLRLASRQSGGDTAEARTRVMESLIRDEWIRQEAQARDLVVSQSEVQAALDKAQRSGFLSEAALERAGLSEQDVLPTIRKGQLQRKVTAAVTADVEDVSAEDIAEYYRQNRSKMVVTERRDVRLVLTRDRARAAAARLALQRGGSWDSVAGEYSIHAESRDNGGKISDLRKGPVGTGVTAAVFRSREGRLTGPVKVERSWAVFIVEQVKPPFQATLDQARDEISDLLTSQRRQAALADFTRRYRAKTTCAPDHRVRACGDTELDGEPGA